MFRENKFFLGLNNLFFWPAIPTFLAAVLSKGLFIPVVIGMLVVIVGRFLGIGQ